MTVKFYCEYCETHQPVEIEPIRCDDLNPVPWGDIVCSVCHFVIATMTADESGIYDIVKQDDLSKRDCDCPSSYIEMCGDLPPYIIPFTQHMGWSEIALLPQDDEVVT